MTPEPKEPEGPARWIGVLESSSYAERHQAVEPLTAIRDSGYDELLDAWEGMPDGWSKSALAEVLEIPKLREIDIVAEGVGLGYYPKAHLTGIEGDCLACVTGRLALNAKRVIKGIDLLDEAQAVFKLIARLPGHVSHELPELLEACEGGRLALMSVPEEGVSVEELKELDASFKGQEGLWLLRLGPDPERMLSIRASGSIRADTFLTWLCRGEQVDPGAGARVVATLERIAE